MPPCRGHTKSRTGCRTCKKRRVKCDEGRPHCRNCSKHGVECDYVTTLPPSNPNPSPEFDSAFSPLSDSQTMVSIRIPVPPPKPITRYHPPYPAPSEAVHNEKTESSWYFACKMFPGALPPLHLLLSTTPKSTIIPPIDVSAMSLLHHFTISTAFSSSSCPHINKVFTDVLPTLGFKHPFLLHSILAAAATHRGNKALDDIVAAEKHHRAAMHLIAPELHTVDESNAAALFLAASLRGMYDFTNTDLHPPPTPWRVEMGWIRNMQSAFGVLDLSWRFILLETSPILPLLQPPRDPPTTLPPEISARLQALFSLCTDLDLPNADELDDPATAAAYFLAIKNLRRLYAVLYSDPKRRMYRDGSRDHEEEVWNAACQFVLRTPAPFWGCLEKCRPRALVVYAHYFVAWAGSRRWWIRGKARKELQGVLSVLEEQWESWLEWPRIKIDELEVQRERAEEDADRSDRAKTSDASLAAAEDVGEREESEMNGVGNGVRNNAIGGGVERWLQMPLEDLLTMDLSAHGGGMEGYRIPVGVGEGVKGWEGT